MTTGEDRPSQELISGEEAVEFLEATVSEIDFEGSLSRYGGPANVATQIAHWTLETFGQAHRNSDGYSICPGRRKNHHGEFSGEELPGKLKHLVSSIIRDELRFSGENNVYMEINNQFIEEEPYLPRYDEIRALETFREQIAFIRANPDILKKCHLGRVAVVPCVQTKFEPAFSYEWGLVFNTSPRGIQCAPFGKPGNTWEPTEFVLETQDNEPDLAKIVSQLSVLAAKYTHLPPTGTVKPAQLELLDKRLTGEEDLPLIREGFSPKPGGNLKRLLIEQAKLADN